MAMLIEPLALETPIAGFNGGLFVRPDLTNIEEREIPPDVAKQAFDLILKHELDAWAYSGNDWLVRDPAAPHADREAWTVKFRPKAVTNFASALQKTVKIVGVSNDLERVKRCESGSHTISMSPVLTRIRASARATCRAFSKYRKRRLRPSSISRTTCRCSSGPASASPWATQATR
jgi:hypothetical protein